MEMELQCAPVHVRVRRPMTSATVCVAWPREMLR